MRHQNPHTAAPPRHRRMTIDPVPFSIIEKMLGTSYRDVLALKTDWELLDWVDATRRLVNQILTYAAPRLTEEDLQAIVVQALGAEAPQTQPIHGMRRLTPPPPPVEKKTNASIRKHSMRL
jgi:hypothetical protein